jgi:hypothetical protein
MKTKNFLLTGAFLIVALFSVNGVMAQSPAKSGQTTVTISLKPMQAITVNQSNVLLEYATINDYSNGVETDMKNHLTVHSVGAFTVRVTADANFKDDENNEIPMSDVILTASAVGGSSVPDVYFKPITLGGESTALISATSGGMNLEYDVKYSNTLAGNAFKYAEKKGGDYTAMVTYTIAAY